VVNQKAGALGRKGKAAAVVSTASVATAKPEGEVKAEDEREVLVECGEVVPIEVSSEAPHDAPEEHHHGDVEVPVGDVGSHEDGGSVPTSPEGLLEGEEVQYADGSVHEDNVTSPPPVSGSDHEHEHERPFEEEYGTWQPSEEQEVELLKDDVPALPEPSDQEMAEAVAHPGAEEHLEKVAPRYQPSVLPTGEQVDEEKQEKIDGIPDDA